MSVTGFKNTDEEVPLNHSIEKEKTIRHIGYLSSSYSEKIASWNLFASGGAV